jgi:dTDP-L-rhamnose 4-epimerase
MVTGGAGFIGSAISGELARRFDRVIAVDNLHPQIHPQQVRPAALDQRVELVIGDVNRKDTWDQLLRDTRPGVVVHLAAETGTGQSLTEATRHANVNVTGTTQMLDAFARCGTLPYRIVLISSRAVYGEGAWRNVDTGEIIYPGQRSRAQLQRGEWEFSGLTALPLAALTTQPRPTSIYGATKLAQEHILRAWAVSFAVDTAILRLQNVYGPGQSVYNPYAGIVPLFALSARAGETISLYEDGEVTRDFVFIEDVAQAICRVACDGAPSDIPYDVGSGEATSIRQLATIIAGIYQAPAPSVTGAFRNGDVRHASCDILRTRTDLAWAPSWSIEQGVIEVCRWVDKLATGEGSEKRASG